MKSLFLLIILNIVSVLSYAQTAEDYYIKGIEKFSNRDAAGAIVQYNKALSLDPKHVDALFNRGVAKIAIDDYKGAIEDMDKTLALKPNFTNAFYARGAARAYLQQYKQALEDMNQLINLDPEFSKAYTLRAQMKYALKDSSGACRDFKQALTYGDREAEKLMASYCEVKPSNDGSNNYGPLKLDKDALVEILGFKVKTEESK